MAKTSATERRHKATYSTDNRKGGYLIRVQGPQCNQFAGRNVPVTLKGDKGEHEETLTRLIWFGNDDGKVSGYVGPVALYEFQSKPREKADEVEF